MKRKLYFWFLLLVKPSRLFRLTWKYRLRYGEWKRSMLFAPYELLSYQIFKTSEAIIDNPLGIFLKS